MTNDMPGKDGWQLVQKLPGWSANGVISVSVLPAKPDISETLALHDYPANDFVEKPLDATQRIKPVIDKSALEKMSQPSNPDGAVPGSLKQRNDVDLVQILEMGRKSCLLTLTGESDRRGMYFTEGQVIAATCGALAGNAAVFQVVRWTAGNFQVNSEARTTGHSTTLTTQALVIEGLRFLDHERRNLHSQGEEEEDVLLDS